MTARSAAEFLNYLRERDIIVQVSGENLRFNAPEGAFTPELRAELIAKKPEIIRFLQEAQRIASFVPPSETPPILPASRASVLPLSFAQQRLWFLEQFDPGRPTYNICPCFALRGAVNAAVLEASLNAIIARHEALRTVFPAADGQPAQKILPSVLAPFNSVSLTHLPTNERETEASRLLAEQTAKPFDLQTGPPIRALLIEFAPQDYRLLLGLHHIVCDGWAMSRLISELSAIYNTALRGAAHPLAPLTIQYPDFAVWQRANFAAGAPGNSLAYWKAQLADAPPALNLPLDLPRPSRPTYCGGMVKFAFPTTLTRSLQSLSRQENATLFMTLLAAFQTLLFRYTGQEDLCVGTPIANRQRAELEPLIGFFVNTLVMRGDLSGSPTFRQLLQRARTAALAAYEHQDAPFEQVVEAVQPERSLQQSPLFQVLFALQNTPQESLKLDGTQPAHLQYLGGVSKFDLSLFLEERGDAIIGDLEYSTDLFLPATMKRFAGHFQVLLAALSENPDAPIDQLPLLTPAERQQILTEWNQTDRDYPRHLCVHQLFERQAETTPNSIALTPALSQTWERENKEFPFAQTSLNEGNALSPLPRLREWGARRRLEQGLGVEAGLTYTELNQKANQLARLLRQNGVGAETRVGICLPRSPEMVTALLAVLKAGGAYVPLDPAYPAERLAFMLQDAAAPVLLTTTELKATLPPTDAEVVCLDAIEAELAQFSAENLASIAEPDNLAYVLYTSGSTGKPKGVAMPHRALINLISWQIGQDTLSVGSPTLQFTPLSFDVSFQEIFATLCSGGKLLLITQEMQRDAMALLRFMAEAKVERIFLPYIALQNLAQAHELGGALPASLREIVTAGEALQITPQIRLLMQSLPNCRLHNHYGPTETHVVTAHTLTGSPEEWPALPPIGKPLPNVKAYILDQNLNPVPIGVPGELYLAGDGLAKGYLNRPDLTAERFIFAPAFLLSDRHPTPDTRHPRLYRTGDLARYLPNGDIQYLGRMDAQVKIRGHRVEPGEIETALLTHPNVQESAVIVHDANGDKRLVAYIAVAESPAFAADELRRFLKNALPEYMIPSVFVRLDALPKTPSGKIARRLLPAPDDARPEITAPFVAPQSEIEQMIAAIWRDVLQLKSVGVHDNFFDIGGHSLRIAQVQARLQQALRQEIAIVTLFQYPTIRALAESLRGDSESVGNPGANVNAIQERARRQREALASRRAPR